MNYYELLYIVQPTLSEEELKNITDGIAEIITKSGGEILKNEIWQKKNLAYPIKKYKQGYYVLVHFKAQPNLPKKLEEKMRIKEDILRFMTTVMLKKDIASYTKQQEEKAVEDKKENDGESE